MPLIWCSEPWSHSPVWLVFLLSAAAWALVGFVWEVFESTTEAIGDASEVRCAYQLGKGRPEMAKLSAYKSILLAFTLSVISTGIFLGISSELPSWLTKDPTIQVRLICIRVYSMFCSFHWSISLPVHKEMIASCIPLIALGSVTMNTGMICWALVGAQRRYHLATLISLGCSLLITLPVGLIVTLWLKIDLQGLTFAVVVGYTFTALILSSTLLSSNWEQLSAKIVQIAADEEDSESMDESSSSSSSSDSPRKDLVEILPVTPRINNALPPPLPNPPTTQGESEIRQSQQGDSPPGTPTKTAQTATAGTKASPLPPLPTPSITKGGSMSSQSQQGVSPTSTPTKNTQISIPETIDFPPPLILTPQVIEVGTEIIHINRDLWTFQVLSLRGMISLLVPQQKYSNKPI